MEDLLLSLKRGDGLRNQISGRSGCSRLGSVSRIYRKNRFVPKVINDSEDSDQSAGNLENLMFK